MSAVSRSGAQRLLLVAVALVILVLVLLATQQRPGPLWVSQQVAVDRSPAEVTGVGSKDTDAGQAVRVESEALDESGSPASGDIDAGNAETDEDDKTVPDEEEEEASAAASLRHVCGLMRDGPAGLTPDVRHVMRWVCEQVGGSVPMELDATGCNKAVRYHSIGRLGNLMGLYAIIYSFGRMYGATGYVDASMWSTLHKYFPDISLHSTKDAPSGAKWEDITYQQAKDKLKCQPDEGGKPRFFRITNYPDRNGIDVFHPFYEEIRKEFRFSDALQKQAQEFLQYARGSRSSATYIGFHVRRTDYQNYIKKTYNGSLPGDVYFNKTLTYYRDRYPDALFIVCSDDLSYVAKELKANQNDDIVIAGNRDTGNPGRDMALLSACNHSIVTVGTYGFWSAYLAGGTVLVPEQQTHLSRGDRHAPLLEIQLAGATNWVSMRRR